MKFNRFTSMFVMVALAWMLQLTLLPLDAPRVAPAQSDKSYSTNHPNPAAFEHASNSAKAAKKHSILLILIGVTAAVAIGAVLILVVFKSKYNPHIDPADFVAGVNNPYWPLVPGQTMFYNTTTDEGTEEVEVTTTDDTKAILGVTCVVVHDVVKKNGAIIEDTWDWYAQDKDGNVWYFGEDTKAYEGSSVSTEGSWEAGVDGAKPGIVMYGNPQEHIGEPYRQEYRKGVAEDWSEVLSVNETVTVPFGSFTNCVKTRDYSKLEPDVEENKYFAPGIGNVLTVTVKGGNEREELIRVTNE